MIVGREVVIETIQGKSMKEGSKRACIGRRHHFTPQDSAEVKVSEEDERKRQLQNQGKLNHHGRPGFTGQGTPYTPCTYDAGKDK